MASIVGSIIAIIVCGGIGGVGGWALAAALGLTGVPGALVAAAAGIVLAAALWTAGSSALRAVGWLE
jgi:hypothetical protein